MGLHQAPVPGLAERLEGDRLLGPLHRLLRIPGAQGRVGQNRQRTAADVGELASLLLHPRPFLAGQEGLAQQRLGERRVVARLVDVAGRERRRGLVSRGRGREHVDPCALGQFEPVAAERTRESAAAVDPLLRQQRPQPAHDPREGLVPRWRRCLPPQRLRQLIPRHGSAALGHQVGEQEPTLPSGKARLVDGSAVGLQGHTTQQRNPWLQTPCHVVAQILPRFGVAFLASPRGIVDRVIQCDCGFEVRGAHEDALVAEVQRHALDAHGMALSHEEALVLAFRAELDEEASTTTLRKTTPHRDEEER